MNREFPRKHSTLGVFSVELHYGGPLQVAHLDHPSAPT